MSPNKERVSSGGVVLPNAAVKNTPFVFDELYFDEGKIESKWARPKDLVCMRSIETLVFRGREENIEDK